MSPPTHLQEKRNKKQFERKSKPKIEWRETIWGWSWRLKVIVFRQTWRRPLPEQLQSWLLADYLFVMLTYFLPVGIPLWETREGLIMSLVDADGWWARPRLLQWQFSSFQKHPRSNRASNWLSLQPDLTMRFEWDIVQNLYLEREKNQLYRSCDFAFVLAGYLELRDDLLWFSSRLALSKQLPQCHSKTVQDETRHVYFECLNQSEICSRRFPN